MLMKRKLGQSDLELTTIGLGSWGLGGAGWEYSWGHQDDQETVATIHRALECGINWIDTAPVYGLGHAEEIIGKLVSSLKEKPLIATKCGLIWNDHREILPCLTRDSVRKECEDSLKRLRIDTIDLYQIHWPRPVEQIEEAWETLLNLQKEGKIRYPGVSNFNMAHLSLCEQKGTVTSLQPPYSILRRDIEKKVLPWCSSHGTGVIAYSPLQKGLLTGKVSSQWVEALSEEDHRKRKDPLFQEPQLSRIIELVINLTDLAKRYGMTTPQLAIAWVLHQPGVTAAIVGARHPAQIAETVRAGEILLEQETLAEVANLIRQYEQKA